MLLEKNEGVLLSIGNLQVGQRGLKKKGEKKRVFTLTYTERASEIERSCTAVSADVMQDRT